MNTFGIANAVSRRGILVAGAGAAGAAVLAACSGGSDADEDRTAAAPSGSTTAPAPPPSAAPPSTGAPGGSGGSALVALTDLAVGASTSVKLADGKPAIVTRTGTASAVCFSAVCTHEGCTVKPKDRQLDCPCHGSSFDARTGKVLGGPAPSPLPEVDVTVTNGAVTEA